MKTKLLLATLALAVTPSLAMAMGGCGFGHAKTDEVAMSCAEGSTYSTDLQRCVPITTG